MNVTFFSFGDVLASSRLRAIIPQRELAKLGIKKGRDCLVYGKHWLSLDAVGRFGRRIYDVCDDHFDGLYGDYYREHIAKADLVTCNSEVMRQRIMEETGRDATVIPEPYESDEKPPSIGERLFWYGHHSNLKDLARIIGELRHPLLVMTNQEHPDYVPWSPENFAKAMETPCVVIIPTGKSKAKSENRMVEAIRCGKYVCAEHLPSYEPFAKFFPLGGISNHIDLALENQDAALYRIGEAQAYVRKHYSSEAIGKKWLEVINVNSNVCRATDSGRELAPT